MSMALGLVAASIFQIVALAWTLPCRLGLPRFGDLDIRETLRLGSKAVPVILSLLPATAAPAIVIAAAVRINPASAAHLGYCSSFATLCSVAIGSGLGIVALRSVAEQHATGGVAQVRAMADARIRYVLLLGSLTTVALWSGRQEVIRLLFQRGNFDPGAAAGVANLLPWYLLVSICAACQTVLRSLFNATGRYSIPALLGMAMTVVLYVSVLLCRSNVTVAMAYAGASVLYAMAAIAFVGVPDLLALAAFAARVTATAAFSIVASVLFRRALPAADGLAMSVFVGGAAAGFGCAVFALTGGFVTGLEEVRRVFACRARVWQLAVGSSR
jgi:putative peptidoglycan lipid II flippase